MATGEEKRIVSKLDCSICLSSFKDPKLIPCFHTFCLQCLDEYVTRNGQDGKFECPLCRAVTCIPEGGVRAFQSNFYIQSMELSKVVSDCEICDNGLKCSHYCVDCEEHLCEKCAHAHTRMKVTREHKILALNDSEEGFTRKVYRKAYCPHHSGEEIKMICKDCDTLLCVVCKLTEHENHITSGISKEATDRKTILREKIVKTKDKLNNLHGDIVKVDAASDEVKNKLEKSVSELAKRVEAIVASVKLESDKIKQELQKSCEEALNYYAAEKKKLLQNVSETQTILNHAENVIDIGDDLQVLDTSLLTKLASFEVTEENDTLSIQEYLHVIFRPDITQFNSNLIGRNVKIKHRLREKERIDIPHSQRYNSNHANVMSLSNEILHVGYHYSSRLYKFVTSNTCKPVSFHIFPSRGVCPGMTRVKTDIYFTCLINKIVYTLKNNASKASAFRETDNHPHGIAFSARRNELLVCVLNSSEVFEVNPKEGCVYAVPLKEEKKMYKWRETETPGATCIAANDTGDIVCLGYPAAGKITLHTQNGDLLSEFTGAGCEGSPNLFCPVSVCFDVQDCIIIADFGNDTVIRLHEGGSYLQCLVKVKRPLSVVIGKEYILYVGSVDENILKCVLKVENSL